MPDIPKLNDDIEEDEDPADVTRLGAAADQRVVEAPLNGYLTVIAGEHPGKVYALDRPATTLGRGADCELRLDSDGVSRKHARIVRQAGQYVIEDLGSTNGTLVDGNPATPEPLKSGARIRVGTNVVVRFNLLDDEEAALQQRLYENVIQDTLTGAYNRRFFDQSLANEVAQAKRLGTPFSVILLQIDEMKKITDYYTQAGGDALLCKVTKLVQGVARPEDVFARIGPDRFGLVGRGMAPRDACSLAESIRVLIERLEMVWQSGDFSMCIDQITACLSVTTSETPFASAAELLTEASNRLLAGKKDGGNAVVADP